MRRIVSLNLFFLGILTLVIGGMFTVVRRGESSAYWLTYDSVAPVVIHRRLLDGSIYNLQLDSARTVDLYDWSPDGRWLLFGYEHTRDQIDLFRVHVTGTPLQQLTDIPGGAANAVYSPDGAWIVFAAGGRGQWSLYRVRAEGGAAQRLTESDHRAQAPAWSPDGEWIAFYTSDADLRWSIYRMRPDGGGLQQVYESPYAGNATTLPDPVWSPDGAWIIFSDGRPDLSTHIYRMRPDGSALHALTEGDSYNYLPVFAADGLYFSSDRNGGFNIFQLDMDDPASVRAVTTNTDDMFVLSASPDGAWLYALRSDFSTSNGPFGDFNLIRADGSRRQRIRALTAPLSRPTIWSPLIDLPFRGGVLVAVGGVLLLAGMFIVMGNFTRRSVNTIATIGGRQKWRPYLRLFEESVGTAFLPSESETSE